MVIIPVLDTYLNLNVRKRVYQASFSRHCWPARPYSVYNVRGRTRLLLFLLTCLKFSDLVFQRTDRLPTIFVRIIKSETPKGRPVFPQILADARICQQRSHVLLSINIVPIPLHFLDENWSFDGRVDDETRSGLVTNWKQIAINNLADERVADIAHPDGVLPVEFPFESTATLSGSLCPWVVLIAEIGEHEEISADCEPGRSLVVKVFDE